MEKHLETNIAQYALIIKNKKMLVLWPSGDNEPLWVLPGGRINAGDENYREALVREVAEEIGCDVEIIEPVYVDMYNVPGKKHRYVVFFLCKIEGKKIELSEEHKSYEWLGYDALMKPLKKEPVRGRAGIALPKELRKMKRI